MDNPVYYIVMKMLGRNRPPLVFAEHFLQIIFLPESNLLGQDKHQATMFHQTSSNIVNKSTMLPNQLAEEAHVYSGCMIIDLLTNMVDL